jgi:uncharacterized membrane protein
LKSSSPTSTLRRLSEIRTALRHLRKKHLRDVPQLKSRADLLAYALKEAKVQEGLSLRNISRNSPRVRASEGDVGVADGRQLRFGGASSRTLRHQGSTKSRKAHRCQFQFAVPKGTLPHRPIGWIWVALMVALSGSAFLILEVRLWGQWSPIQPLAIFTLTALPLAVWHAHNHAVRKHRDATVSLFIGALGIAGVFRLLPGRIIHAAV